LPGVELEQLASALEVGPSAGTQEPVGANLGEAARQDVLEEASVPSDWLIEAFIEHENDVRRAEETVRKLLQLGPGLKVLVTYPRRDAEADWVSQFAELIRTRHGTSSETRLVIVFGYLEAGGVKWAGWDIDGLGRCASVALESGNAA